MKLRPAPIIFLIIFLAVSAVYVFSSNIQTDSVVTIYQIWPVVAALIAAYAARIYNFKSANGRAQLLIASGLVFWGVAETITYVLFLQDVSPFPSIADYFFLLAYPLLGAGIWQGYITSGIKLKQVKKSLLIAVLLASLVLAIVVGYFGVYQAYDSTADLLENTINIIYGLADLVLIVLSLLTILVASEYQGGKLASFWKTMAVGFFIMLMADIMFSMYGDLYFEDVKPYTYIDLLWLASYLSLAYAMLANYLHISEVQKKIKMMISKRNNPVEVSV